ncbi:MAG: formimidoylglutamase [Fimbriimonadales bacterium]
MFSRGDKHDPRLGDVAREVSFAELDKERWDLAILGFPDDRGVTLNRGRPGAAAGPNVIRNWFYRLVPPTTGLMIADLGDLEMSSSLENDHATATTAIAAALGRAQRVVILGGGHDWGYSPIAALMQSGRTGFVNLDAHLDVRASETQHSGTSFWRALETGVRGQDAFWYGVQRPSNAQLHLDYAIAKGGTVAFAEDDAPDFSSLQACDAIDLSLDMDAFAMAEAPGVSAPHPTGLYSREVLPILRRLFKDPKVRTFGIYEASPPNDQHDITTRLAARCLWEALAK